MKPFGEWKVGTYSDEDIAELQKQGYSKLLSALLCARGLAAPDKAKEFMRHDTGLLLDPMLMTDMDKAVARIKKAVANKERVAIYGDYDVDGLTSSTLMASWFRRQGIEVETYIPERLTEGYGISEDALKCIKSKDVTLIVTVDCGVTAIEQVALAKEMGIELVITDHHECLDTLPDAVAVVNPHRKDCPYPFKGLAGVGVAFKLICALEGPEKLEQVIHDYCELVAIGTIADIMPVIGENRTIIHYGLQALRATENLGLDCLMSEIGIDKKKINGTDVSFNLIPKLNAAGRMGRVQTAFELLMVSDVKEAPRLAAELCQMNMERRQVENRIFSEAIEMLGDVRHIDTPIVLATDNWHHGVSGIVASRLAERFGVPSVIICLEGESGRGSCRSYGCFNVFEALDYCKDTLTSFGGHEYAAGLTLKSDMVEAFKAKLTEYYVATEGERLPPCLPIDYCVEDMSLLTIEEIETFKLMEPWGMCNAPPSLCLRDVTIESLAAIGNDRHLKMRISKDGQYLDCIFFMVTLKDLGMKVGTQVDIAFEPGINDFRGVRSVQLLLKDMRAARRFNDPSLKLARKYLSGASLLPMEKAILLPDRTDCARVWNHITHRSRHFTGRCEELLPDIALHSNSSSLGRVYICLKTFDELGLIKLKENDDRIDIHIPKFESKVCLTDSAILERLR
jgi:single-stranded-DNA-specific exonuclease